MNKKIMISGMSCQHCVNHVQEALREVSGIAKVSVDLVNNLALIQASTTLSDEMIKEAVSEAGYQVTAIEDI